MTQSPDQLFQRFNALSAREKNMSTLAVIVLLWAAWDNLLHQPLQKQSTTLDQEIKGLESNLSSQQLIAEQIRLMDPRNPLQEQLHQLENSVENLKRQLASGEKKFVPPQQMATALRDMLRQHGNLKLIKLETLPTKPFGNQDNQQVWVYRHTMELTVQGDFFSTLDYLKALENLPWRVHWNSIDYRVNEYPLAETNIQVYTLSFEKDWLGA